MFRLGESRGRAVRTIGALSAVGLALVLAIVIGAGLGLLLDRWLGTRGVFFILFFFVGVAAGVLNVFRMSARYLHDREGPRSGPPPD